MNIAKNMKGIFLDAVCFAAVAAAAAAATAAATPTKRIDPPAAVLTKADANMQVVTITGKRLGAAKIASR